MKLLRYGPKGQEKPGLLDKDGQIRDLSGVVKDIDGKVLADLSAIRAAKVESLPVVAKGVRIAEPVAKVRQVPLHRPQLCRPCRRIRHARAGRADHLHEGDQRPSSAPTTTSICRPPPRRATGKSSWAS